MLDKVNLADVRAFVLIVQQGSFTRAAEVMQVSRSHVSRQLTALEAALAITLITRTTRSLGLTEAGKLFFNQAKASLNHLEQALLATVEETAELRGTIRVNSVGGHLGEDIVASLCSEFLTQYPDVEIALDFSSHRIDLINDEFDIAFRMGELDNAGFIGRKLRDIAIDTLASPDYLSRAGRPKHPRELSDHHCLTGSIQQWQFQHKSKPNQSYETLVQGRLRCKNGRALVQAAIAGNGIVRVPVMYCQQEIAQQRLESVFLDWEISDVPFHAIYHKDRYQPERLKCFIQFMTDAFAKMT